MNLNGLRLTAICVLIIAQPVPLISIGPIIHANSVPSLSNIPLATDDGQDPTMVVWTGFARSWWVARNIPDWSDTAFCSGPKTVGGRDYNETLQYPDPSGLSCIGPRAHVRIWDMGNSSTSGEWSVGSVHHEHTVCDPLCHHVIDSWQSALSELRSSILSSQATISISTIFLGNTGVYQNVGFDGNALLVELGPPPATNKVVFTENGLNYGEKWSVNLDGRVLSTTSSTITFWEQEGVLAYSVNSPEGFQSHPTSGTINTIKNETQRIIFRTIWTTSSINVQSPSGLVSLGFGGNATVSSPSASAGPGYSTVFHFVTAELGQMGVLNVTIPKTSVASGSTPAVYLDGAQISHTTKESPDDYYVSFAVAHGSHNVEIQFTSWYSFLASPVVFVSIPAAIVVAITAAAWKRVKNQKRFDSHSFGHSFA